MIAYVSKAVISNFKDPIETAEVTNSIYTSCVKNNVKHGVTGLLYYGNQTFFQCLEGDKQIVLDLMERIKTDPRHECVTVIASEHISERRFSKWSMKLVFGRYYIGNLVDQIAAYSFQHSKLNQNHAPLLENLLKLF